MGFGTLKRLAMGCVPHSAAPALPSQDTILSHTKRNQMQIVCLHQPGCPLHSVGTGPHGRQRLREGRITKLQVISGLYSA